jgi:hypothetical protein
MTTFHNFVRTQRRGNLHFDGILIDVAFWWGLSVILVCLARFLLLKMKRK